jgi:hypothetical protein
VPTQKNENDCLDCEIENEYLKKNILVLNEPSTLGQSQRNSLEPPIYNSPPVAP